MDDLAKRCDEILSWRKTGIYEGDALAHFAERYQEDISLPPIRRAEQETIREALELCATPDLPERGGSDAISREATAWAIENTKVTELASSDPHDLLAFLAKAVRDERVLPPLSTPAPAGELEEMLVPLAWLNDQRNVEIAYYRPVYCDDDDDAEEWRVFRVNGGVNDREWAIIGRGQTFEAALQDAAKDGWK